jgi:aspartyl-tRNA(Asn)/glutamyl-tRNA(Gln) amidotransferase subunit A
LSTISSLFKPQIISSVDLHFFGSIAFMTLALTKEISSGSRSALEVISKSLEMAQNDSLNAFISLNPQALATAATIDARVKAGEHLPLAGYPLAVKDNIVMRGLGATAGSRILEKFVSPYTSTALQRLLNAGAVVIGKANCDEFGMGSSGENSAYGATKNPRDPSRVPGGSSSGSAAAVAQGMVSGALGTDTGGSIRLPAAFCGVLGMKPTYGRISRYGVIAYASSLDQVGPFARSTADLAALLEVMSGHDPMDATSLVAKADFSSAVNQDIKTWKIGLVREGMGSGNSPAVLGAMDATRVALEQLGATVVDVSLPSLENALAAYYLIACPEASSNLARYDGMVYSNRADGTDLLSVMSQSRGLGFGAEVKRRILMGTYALSSGYYDAFYSKALRARAMIAADFARVFAGVDALLMPTAPSTAFELGAKADPLEMYLTDVDTVAVNLAGLPAISLPFGYENNNSFSTSSGLPIGVQFIAPTLEDARLISISAALEQHTNATFLKPVLE